MKHTRTQIISIVAGSLLASFGVSANNIFQENAPQGGPYRFESEHNWSQQTLSYDGNWFVPGAALLDEQSGNVTVHPKGEKSNFFLGFRGQGGTLTIEGGRLEVKSNLFMHHIQGKGSLYVKGGELIVQENLAQTGAEIVVSGGKVEAQTVNVQVDRFQYTGGEIEAEFFGIAQGVLEFQLGGDAQTIQVEKGMFGDGTLVLSFSPDYVHRPGTVTVLFECGNSNMTWSDSDGNSWKDGAVLKFGDHSFEVKSERTFLTVEAL